MLHTLTVLQISPFSPNIQGRHLLAFAILTFQSLELNVPKSSELFGTQLLFDSRKLNGSHFWRWSVLRTWIPLFKRKGIYFVRNITKYLEKQTSKVVTSVDKSSHTLPTKMTE